MHPVEVETALKTMQIIVDSREQPTEQSKRRYALFDCPYRRDKLNAGDYSAECILPNGETFTLDGMVSIERKMNLDELAMCYTHDRERFKREFERGKEAGIKTYLLIENSSWELAYNGKYRS